MNKLKSLMPKTLRSKLRLALFAVGFFPYFFILIYIHNLGEKKILDNTLTAYHIQMREVKQRIDEQLLSLKKEIHFLASLDIMNDMIVGDVDKRIGQLFLQKQNDLSYNTQIFAINTEDKIIASTENNTSSMRSYVKKINKVAKENKNYFFTKESIVLFTPIYSTLQEGKSLGYLCVAYALSNLSHFIVKDKGIQSMIYEPKKKWMIGKIQGANLLTLHKRDKRNTHDSIGDKHIVLHEYFDGILSQWMIVYRIQKSVALTFLNEFIWFLWGLFIFGFIVIAMTSLWMSKRILEPIATLSKATQSIISTKDYTTQVSLASQGEISDLARDFNVMIRETNQAFEVLEEENKLRLFRFIQLINIFNRLIKTESEEKCIDVAIHELQTFMPHQTFSFSSKLPKDMNENHYLMISVKDFDKQISLFYGVIILNTNVDTYDINEEKFYHSVATMIMLQLDHIRLIRQTQEISNAKSTFISLMSHELRTPLHAILSASQYLIGYENLTPEQEDKISTMESSAHHLLSMINDILDLAKIEAGKVLASPINISSDDIVMLIEDIMTMLGALVDQKGIQITLENQLLKPMQVHADMRLLKQILINLLSNSIKFTEVGSIAFVLRKCDECLCIDIKDTGIGISANDLEQLFEEFTQVKNRADIQEKGSGLGLAISRKLAKLFDADVLLESKGEGFGTTARITLKGTFDTIKLRENQGSGDL